MLNNKSKRRNKQAILQLLEEFSKSGMGVKSFCNRYSIGRSTFHKWQSRYNHKREARGLVTAGPGFAAIDVINAAGQSSMLFAEVKGIKLYQPVTAAYLKELLL